MTADEYKAIIRKFGMQPCRPSRNGSTLHKTRDDQFQQIPDPENLSDDERTATIGLIRFRIMELD